MTKEHKRLQVITTILTCALIITAWFLVALIRDYKQLDLAVAKCYGAAEASSWTAIALEEQIRPMSDKDVVVHAKQEVASVLAILDKPSYLDAMATCDNLFYRRG